MIRCLGLDIGGANLKASDGKNWHTLTPFPLWREPSRLAEKLLELSREAPEFERAVLTMSGELCDCFPSKQAGVVAIVESAVRAFGDRLQIYLVDGRRVVASQAVIEWPLAAAANWHAIAMFAARQFPTQSGLLIDLGSTTTDVVPFAGGRVIAKGRDDLGRLCHGELLYLGATRPPVFSVLPELAIRGRRLRLASEYFATMRDVYLWLRILPECPSETDTADGRPATREAARLRLARTLCADVGQLTALELDQLATEAHQRHLEILSRFLAGPLSSQNADACLVVSGSGEWLACAALQRIREPRCLDPRVQATHPNIPIETTESNSDCVEANLHRWSQMVSPAASAVASAYALAQIGADVSFQCDG